MDVMTQDWSRLDHRDVAAKLIGRGWMVCGLGDWAMTLRHPDGLTAARVCPFDPAYPVFIALCRQLPEHRLLPRVDKHVALDGGGQLTFMEFLTPAPEHTTATFKARWDDPGDTEMAALRSVARRLDTAAAAAVPWWDGIDLNGGNIMIGADGGVKLVDIYCVDGEAMYRALLEDPVTLRRRIPAEARRHMADIGYVARVCSSEEIARLRAAVAAVS